MRIYIGPQLESNKKKAKLGYCLFFFFKEKNQFRPSHDVSIHFFLRFMGFFFIMLFFFFFYSLSLDQNESYFGKNVAKEEYLMALTSDPPASCEKLTNLLFRRAIEALSRSEIIREEKPTLLNLNQTGALSESM